MLPCNALCGLHLCYVGYSCAKLANASIDPDYDYCDLDTSVDSIRSFSDGSNPPRVRRSYLKSYRSTVTCALQPAGFLCSRERVNKAAIRRTTRFVW
jgi:hypothetical protein